MPPTSLYGHDAPNENSLSYRGAVLHNGTVAVPGGVPKAISQHVPVDWKYRVAPSDRRLSRRPADRPGCDRRH